MTSLRSRFLPLSTALCCLTLVVASCGGDEQKGTLQQSAATDSARTYTFYGKPLGIDSATQMVNIDHEQIADYMEPMTMPFKLADTALYSRIRIGERQHFTLEVVYNMAKITGVE